MPQRDNTGPEGKGQMTGRKSGSCTGNNTEKTQETQGRRMGVGHRRGMGSSLRRRLGRNGNTTQ